jgi:hypothetical protein
MDLYGRPTKQWLEPGKGVGHVVETLIVDKILRKLPRVIAARPHASRSERAGSPLLVSRNGPRDSGSNRRTRCGSHSRLRKYGYVSGGADGDLHNTATRRSSHVLCPWRHPLLPHCESVHSQPERKVYSQGGESTPADCAIIDQERLSSI